MLATHQLNRLPAAERGITIADFLVPIRIGEHMSARLRHIALVCIGAFFIAMTANITVWLPNNPIPITGQTLSVLVVGGALGLRRGVLSVALYLTIGLFLPVYAGQAHGLDNIVGVGSAGVILGARGGYLVSFLLAGALVGWLAELGCDLVIEFVGKDDPMVRRLLLNKRDDYADYDQTVFEACLGRAFAVESRMPLESGTRTLYACRALGRQ